MSKAEYFWSGVGVIVVVIVIFNAGLIAGKISNYSAGRDAIRIEALSRGYAEYVPAKNSLNNPIWQWVEPEGE